MYLIFGRRRKNILQVCNFRPVCPNRVFFWSGLLSSTSPVLLSCPLPPHVRSLPMPAPSPCPLPPPVRSLPLSAPSPCPLHPLVRSIPLSAPSPCPLPHPVRSLSMYTLPHPVRSLARSAPSPCPRSPPVLSISPTIMHGIARPPPTLRFRYRCQNVKFALNKYTCIGTNCGNISYLSNIRSVSIFPDFIGSVRTVREWNTGGRGRGAKN